MTEQTIQTKIKNFLDSLNTADTRKAYNTPLVHFCTYLAEQKVKSEAPISTLTVNHAIGFATWLRGDEFKGKKPAKATIQLYLTAVYRFYRSLLKQEGMFTSVDIARLEETYRDARHIRGEARPKDPKLEAVLKIIAAARSVPPVTGDKPGERRRELARRRNIAIVETLRSSGCRVGELVALRREDLDWVEHGLLVKGKGTKYRRVYLDDDAWRALAGYLRTRQDGGEVRTLAHIPVFCGHGPRSQGLTPLTTRQVERVIVGLAKRAGLAEARITPHYFRHVFATHALVRTENLALVQDMLGHASPATTRVYAKTDERQRRQGFDRVWKKE